jgi:hypothetical protein
MTTKSVAQKMSIKPGMTIWFSEASKQSLIGPLPDRVTVSDRLGASSVGVVFARDEVSLRATLAECGDDLLEPAALWVAYPKANRTDLNRDTLWPIVSEYGLRPNGQVAIDDVWSVLRFRANRDGEAPFLGGRAT